MNEKSIFRRLPIPAGAGFPMSAQVFLSERPGGKGVIADQFAKIKTTGISKVWCLLTDSEWELAASYREAVTQGLLVAEHHRLPLRASCLANDKLRLEESLKLMVTLSTTLQQRFMIKVIWMLPRRYIVERWWGWKMHSVVSIMSTLPPAAFAELRDSTPGLAPLALPFHPAIPRRTN